MKRLLWLLSAIFLLGVLLTICRGEDAKPTGDGTKVEENVVKGKDGSKTDDEVVKREEEAIKLDTLNVAQMRELHDKAEKQHFQAEVDRMMKLIINSLYKNKEIFLRELISNASDALDKIRFLSLTNKDVLAATPDLTIRIRADKEANTLHVIDTGIGMTKEELSKNLGTIAKSGTSDFLSKMSNAKSQTEMNDLIGQFGVGFYSSFLVSDRVTVVTKSNDDPKQYVWESDASSFSIVEDPRGNTLKRGTEVILHLKEEARDFLQPDSLKDLVKKYSQFINFPIYVWSSKTEMVEEAPKPPKKDAEKKDEDATVEEEKDKETKKVEKTVWDWQLLNESKPIWTRKPADIKNEEYTQFYKAFTKESDEPLAKTHFTAEGEVTFKSILFVPKRAPYDMFSNTNKKTDNIKMFVRRVFITDDFDEMMPKYLNFIKGVVDSDDLPLNVSRETLQQHKLLKVIKKKLVRKTLEMIKKISKEEYAAFWKEFSTNIKLGVIEDHANRTRLAQLLRFWTSHSEKEQSSLNDYVGRMKEKQNEIYFIAGQSKAEVKASPFVERLLKKGYEVIYLVEPVDEYTVQALPEFAGKKFQNVAKEGLKLDDSTKAKERKESLEKEFAPLLKWLKEDALKDRIEKAEISERLTQSPCALVASSYGWSANMERIMRSQAYQKSDDASQSYYASQKKTLEVNPRHPLIKELQKRMDTNKEDPTTKNLAAVLFETATLRSGYMLPDTAGFADRIEKMLRLSMNVPLEEKVEEEEEEEGKEPEAATDSSSNASEEKKTDEQKEEEKDKKTAEPTPTPTTEKKDEL